MTDPLIGLELAKLLQLTDFNWVVYESLNPNGSPVNSKYLNGIKPNEISNGTLAAPTQALLQKWLRENYVHISVSNTSMDVFENNYYPVLNYGFHCGESTTDNIITYKTYEEALEAGLLYGLTLIK